MGLTHEVAHYVAGTRYRDIPPEVVRLAQGFILDGLGVALAGSTDECARIVQAHIRQMAGKEEATVLSTRLYAPIPKAALANGVAGHAMDYDEALGYDQVRSRIRIKLKNGKMIEGRYDVARGHPQKPMSWAELGDKFRDCADLVLPRKNAEEAIQLVGRLEQLGSLKPLLRVLSGGKDNSNKKTKAIKAGSKKWSRTRKR